MAKFEPQAEMSYSDQVLVRREKPAPVPTKHKSGKYQK